MGDGVVLSRDGVWPGEGVFLNIAHGSCVLVIPVILFCTVNWLDVERLNIEVGGLTSEVLPPPLRGGGDDVDDDD